MGCSEVSKNTTAMQAVPLLLFVLLTLGACSHPGYPRYQPISMSDWVASQLRQGYHDIQIDEETYVIVYTNYVTHGFFIHPLENKWVQGAQEYALYRAGELAKSKGAKYFSVLHKDDWNLLDFSKEYLYQRYISMIRGYGSRPIAHPGAGLMIKVLKDYPSSIPSDDDRIYEVEALFQRLIEKNPGLADYKNTMLPDKSVKNAGDRFGRWRSLVSDYDSLSVRGQWVKSVFGDRFEFKPGRSITKEATDTYHVTLWDDHWNDYRSKHNWPILQVQLLQQCVLLAEEMGFEVFKLVNWTVEEYRDATSDGGLRKVWFRTTATVTLHHQKERDSLAPVFVVEEIRPNVMKNK
ncbi:MAG TPA: hypothetical protein DEA71_10635 [Nitrospira sp.]|nr:hypothetical protein [Nitrospira sp.]